MMGWYASLVQPTLKDHVIPRRSVTQLPYRMANDDFFPLRIEKRFERFLGDLLGQETDKIVRPLCKQMLRPSPISLGLLQPTQPLNPRVFSHTAPSRCGRHGGGTVDRASVPLPVGYRPAHRMPH